MQQMVQPLDGGVISWIDDCAAPADSLDIFTTVMRVNIRLHERGDEEAEIGKIIRILAPLDFYTSPPHQNCWNSFFAPRRKASDQETEYPRLADLTVTDVEEWIRLATTLTRPMVRARFADAAWELGRRLGSQRRDLYRFGQLAGEMYLKAASIDATPANFMMMFEAVTRAVSLGFELQVPALVASGFERMVSYADSVDLKDIGLWTAPFDRLLNLKGLSEAKRQRILDQYEARFRATVDSGDLFRIMMTGPRLAKYFHDHQAYEKARAITLFYGGAVLEISAGLDPSLAVSHMGDILEAYRQMGLRSEAEDVRLALEVKGKDVIASMKRRRVEVKLNGDEIEQSIGRVLDVSSPLVALYRLARYCSPSAGAIKKSIETGNFVAPQLVPTAIIGDNGLAVKHVGTYDQDKESQVIMAMAQEMNLTSGVLIGGLEEWKKKFDLGGIPDTPKILDSMLIPADRVPLYQEGLRAFEAGDYVKCIHVLIPQIENSLRKLLRVLDTPTTKTDEDGGYELKNMNDVLHDPKAKEALDEELWYFLKSLYTDKSGMNLRNLVAHGFAPAGAFHRGTAALVVQSVVFLAVVRDEAVSLEREAAGVFPAASGVTEEKVEAAQDMPEGEKRDIEAPSISSVV
jgi:lysyl-tRNA synthetase class 1